jgi:hypothetical protein
MPKSALAWEGVVLCLLQLRRVASLEEEDTSSLGLLALKILREMESNQLPISDYLAHWRQVLENPHPEEDPQQALE